MADKPNMMLGPYVDAEADIVAEGLMANLGDDAIISPGMAMDEGQKYLFLTFGRIKATESGTKGFIRGVLWLWRKQNGTNSS